MLDRTMLLQALVSAETQCPINGGHWDRIGFQGLDPRTDINRSMKMLALLQVLCRFKYSWL
jgi:hypothetical protein